MLRHHMYANNINNNNNNNNSNNNSNNNNNNTRMHILGNVPATPGPRVQASAQRQASRQQFQQQQH
jgi:hypothetical protein